MDVDIDKAGRQISFPKIDRLARACACRRFPVREDLSDAPVDDQDAAVDNTVLAEDASIVKQQLTQSNALMSLSKTDLGRTPT